jgi:hypothetical protein
VLRASGEPVVISFGEFKRRMRASLERKLRAFGSNGRGPGLFGFGPHSELIGDSLGELRVTHSLTVSARLNDADAFEDVDLSSGFVPALITGDITGPQAPGRGLVLAVNGRIAGTARSFRLAGSDVEQFAIVVSDSAFRDGPNSVQVLWASGDGRELALARIGGTRP